MSEIDVKPATRSSCFRIEGYAPLASVAEAIKKSEDALKVKHLVGPEGPQGPKGDTGPQGPQGEPVSYTHLSVEFGHPKYYSSALHVLSYAAKLCD